MKDRVLDEVRKHSLIEDGDSIVVGVSGGADSMALLYILMELREEIEFDIHIAHVNHGVRGEDALRDQMFVEKEAMKLDLPYYSRDVDMVKYGKEKGITSEEAGRELRYGFFREITKKLGGGKIAVAHNKNDQAETLIMRFMRGTGIDGLKGMEFIAADIIRPILGISREDIEKYICDKNIDIVSDMTNFQAIYNRNKVRLELIPYIEEHFNPNIIDTMWRTSEIACLDSDFLGEYTERAYKKVLRFERKDKLALDLDLVVDLHISIIQRLIRHSISKINKSLQGITEAQISNAVDLIYKKSTGKEVHFSKDIVLKIDYDNIIVETRLEKKDDYFHEIPNFGLVNLEEIGYYFNVELISIEDYRKSEKDKNTEYFDRDKLVGDLGVRNRRAGDRFIPLGMKGSKKIKDYFIDEKISKDLRDKIPLIVDRESILWVVGYRTDEKYRIDNNTKNVLKISYEKIQG